MRSFSGISASRRRYDRGVTCPSACAWVIAVFVLLPASQSSARAQSAPGHAHDPHDHAAAGREWSVMVDGSLVATFNRQGGLRGETDLTSQNWLMAMGHRRLGRGTLTVSGMASLEPLTVGASGYSHIFQTGEAYEGLAVTDRQHPHDLFSRLSVGWQVAAGGTRLSLVAAPVGEAALGPVAFMHRASAAENPVAPLSHHTLDSTHIAHSVALARIDRGRVSLEGSMFRGREPDEHRFDLELGAPDSWSARVWFRPAAGWTMQASHGFLNEPEQLEAGDHRRTNASVSWLSTRGASYSAATVAVGRVNLPYSRVYGLLVEGTHHVRGTSIYTRIERQDVESEVLLFPRSVHAPHPGELIETVRAFTWGAVRNVARIDAWSVGLGGDVTAYRSPRLLAVTHGARPVSFHLFLRVSKADPAGRMFEQTLGGSMSGASGTPGH